MVKAGNILHWESCSAVKHGSDLNVVEYSNPEIRSLILCYKICGFMNEIETLFWSKFEDFSSKMAISKSIETNNVLANCIIHFWTWMKRPLKNSKKLFFHYSEILFRKYPLGDETLWLINWHRSQLINAQIWDMGIKFLSLSHFSVKCLKFLTDEIIQERGLFFKSELKVYGFFLNH